MNLTIIIVLICLKTCLIQAASSNFSVLALYGGDDDDAHIDFCKEANKWFPAHSAEHGYTYHSIKDKHQITAANLKKYQVLMFLDKTNKDLSHEQQATVQKYVENGGGCIGFHAAGYNEKASDFPWYHKTLLGSGTFKSNTWLPSKATLYVDSPTHPVMKGLPQKFNSSVNEWYSWQYDLRQNKDIEILASIDKSSFSLGTDKDQTWHSGYYPVIWANKKHRAIYANFGHNNFDEKLNKGLSLTFSSNDQNKFVLQALRWLARK